MKQIYPDSILLLKQIFPFQIIFDNKQSSKHCKFFSAASIFILFVCMAANAQQLELYSGSGPAGNGPTATPGASTFYKNTGTSTTFSAYTPGTTFQVSFSNQQYTSATTPGLTVGAQNSGATASAIGADVLLQPMNSNGSPINSQYTSDPFGTPGTNFDVVNNYGYKINTDSYYQKTAGAALNARNYYGDMTITFSRPVLNPVIHISGIGGSSNVTGSNYLGYYTEFEMSTANVSAGYTLTKLSGSTYFNVTTTKILNSSSTPTTSPGTASFYSSQTTGNNGSGGSVLINTNGISITSITFRVYLRGDGGVGSPNAWAGSTRAGDGFLLSASLDIFNITGNVFDDANGLTDNTVNGTGTNAEGLFANLIDANGNLVASSAVASGGTYSFSNMLTSAYNVIIATSSSATNSSSPSGWTFTGENIGTSAGSDGTVDGKLAVSLTSSSVSNANFGIDQLPSSDNKTFSNFDINYFTDAQANGNPTIAGYQGLPANSPGFSSYYSTLGDMTGSDPEDCSTSSSCNVNSSFYIASISSTTQLYYNGSAVTAGTTISNFSPSLLTIYGQKAQSIVSFTYNLVDNAIKKSTAAATWSLTTFFILSLQVESFTANTIGQSVKLNWTSAAGQGISYYQVWRSNDAQNWNYIGAMKADSASANDQHYDFIDNSPDTGENYYKLKVFNPGTSIETNIVIADVKTTDKNNNITIGPNPTSIKLQIKNIQHISQINIYDINGKLMLSEMNNISGKTLDVSNLSTGIYCITFYNHKGVMIHAAKFIKQNN